jgi:hypothetical protein
MPQGMVSKERIMSAFKKELAALINKYSVENYTNTPDFILAEYLNDCLNAFAKIMHNREKWYTNDVKSTEGVTT